MTTSSLPTVLVVEDDQPLLQLERLVLETAGWSVSIATTAAEARARAQEQHFDLLVTDLVLPDGYGWELAGDLAASTRISPVFTTGHPPEGLGVSRLPSDERWRLLLKPFASQALLQVAARAYLTPLRAPEMLLTAVG